MDEKVKRFYNLGLMYLEKSDTANAIKWLERAAKEGHEEAAAELAKIKGVSQKTTKPVTGRDAFKQLTEQSTKENEIKEVEKEAVTSKEAASSKKSKFPLLPIAAVALVIIAAAAYILIKDPFGWQAVPEEIIEDSPDVNIYEEDDQRKREFSIIRIGDLYFDLPENLLVAFGSVENFQIDEESIVDGIIADDYRYYKHADSYKIGIHGNGVVDYIHTDSDVVAFGNDQVRVGDSSELIENIFGLPSEDIETETGRTVAWNTFSPFEVKITTDSENTITSISLKVNLESELSTEIE